MPKMKSVGECAAAVRDILATRGWSKGMQFAPDGSLCVRGAFLTGESASFASSRWWPDWADFAAEFEWSAEELYPKLCLDGATNPLAFNDHQDVTLEMMNAVLERMETRARNGEPGL